MEAIPSPPAETDLTGDRRRLTAVVYADIAGYSWLIGEDDAGTFARIAELRSALIHPALARHRGRLVNAAGDGFLMLFDSILDAMRFAIEVQRGMASFDGDCAPNRRLRFRMGVNVGDVIPDGSSMHGEGVNIAARLQAVCPVGAVCASRIVREQVSNRLGLPFKELGALTLRNIERPVDAFVLDPAEAASAALPAPAEVRGRSARRVALVALGLLGAGLLAWQVLLPTAPTGKPIAADVPVADKEPPPLSIAVLPFSNLSGDPEQMYLADGIAEDLTTDLVHLAGAFVISRESAFSFRDKATDIREIGHQLGVRYLLEGSVRRIGPDVRINAQLIAAESGAHLWAERFDKPIASLGEGQDDIVARIGSALGVKLIDIDAARAAHAQSGSPAAFDLVLRARSVLNQPTDEERKFIALGLFLQALQADPNSVVAMAGAAAMYTWLVPRDARLKRASELIAKAEARAPDSPDVVAAKFLLLAREGRLREAATLYERLLDVNPSATSLILQIGLCRCWTTPEEALPMLQRTIQLNPRSPHIYNLRVRYAFTLLMVGRAAEAVDMLEPIVQQATASSGPPGSDAYYPFSSLSGARLGLAIGYVRLQRLEEARRIMARALQESDLQEFTVRRWLLGVPRYSDPGYVTKLRQMATDLSSAGLPDHLDETTDSGVPSTGDMRDLARINTPTPMTVPGGRTVRTQDVVDLLAHEKPLILATTPETPTIPGAFLVTLVTGGTLDDDWQPRLARFMQEMTAGNRDRPVLVFSFNRNRWHARNLALRLIALGYTNVIWYRGGWEAWEASGQPRAPLAGTWNL